MLTVEQVKTNVAPWLAPISAGEPAGQNSMFDPRYEALRTKMVALDSPTGGEVEWPDILASGRELLTTATKDLLIASYSTYALLETGNLAGLAVGLEMLRGLLVTYWDTMFPPAKRLRGRGNALDWLVARLELALPSLQFKPEDRPGVELLRSQWKELSAVARDRLGEHCPAMRGVEDVLTRALMSLPAPATPPPSAASPSAAPPSANSDPATPGPNPAPTPPAPGAPTPAAPAAAPAQPPTPASPEAPAATPPAPTPTAATDPLAAAREAAAAWLQPIRADQPVGDDPRYEQEHQDARAEVGKADSPTTDLPQWEAVQALADTILQSKGKDALMAGYVAFSLYQTKGLSKLPTGLMVVAGLLEQFYDAMYPTRPRGRTNALSWFIDQLDKALGAEELKPDQRAVVLEIDAAVKELMRVIRDKMGDDAPGLNPLRDRMQRMLLKVPEKKKEPPPPPPKPAATAAAPRPAVAVKPAAAMPAAGDISSAEEVSKFLLATGQSLVKAATLLRGADAGSSAAYRLLRTGLWLHLAAPPPADAGGKTSVPPLPADRRQQYETILSNGKWLAALEETESALRQFRFCLDLNRMTHTALTGLGESHAQAADAVATETAALLARMPTLPDLTFADGSPFADGETKSWIAEHASLGGGAGGGSATGSDGAEQAQDLAELRGLMKTKPQEGMKLGTRIIERATSPRSRLLCRLALAEACLDAGQAKLARGMYAAIDREMRKRGLSDWDPPLVSRCLEGFIRSIRAAAKAGSPYEGADEIFERLCLVDPAAAAKLS